jgi:monovalent cation/hydrogen antiporter
MTALELLLPRLLVLLALLAGGTLAAKKLPVPAPVVLAVLGMAAASVPGVPEIPLDPDLILVWFLPPLLYADAFQTSWTDSRRWLRPILMLAIGLVAATIAAVGFVAHAVLPGVPLAACFVLGAIVSPTDTVAVQAVIERLRVPRRITAILGGESLINDATGLVGVQVGVAVVAAGGVMGLDTAALEFARVAGVGVAVGVAAGFAFARLNTSIRERGTLFVLSLLAPYLAYWLASLGGGSGVLAVVIAGFLVSWRIYSLQADVRVDLYSTWDMIVILLNGIAFLLVGFQAPVLLRSLAEDGILIGAGLAVSAAAIVTRIAWCFPAAYVPLFLSPRMRAREGGYAPPGAVAVVAWAGVRGAISLSAALSLPDGFPGRDPIVACTMVVVLCTLLFQGLTLMPLSGFLGLREDEDTAAEVRRAREETLAAGIERLDAFCAETSCPIAVFHLRANLEDQLAALREEDAARRELAHSRVSVSKEVQRAVAEAQRERLLSLRNAGAINDGTYTSLLLDLDRASLGVVAD